MWVHPRLSRLLKGPDYKLGTEAALQYWLEQRATEPATEEPALEELALEEEETQSSE